MRVYLAVAVIIAFVAAAAAQGPAPGASGTNAALMRAMAMGAGQSAPGARSSGFNPMLLMMSGGVDMGSMMEYQLCTRMMGNPIFCMHYLN
ncbi:hypothetical protein DPMN_130879 [Dreissena polymorpha]|uniref:Uncharacterized protein n=1 Tax=Dreissena polymorpha TaxID=45954 RepID=A0A9D4H3M0_DREPO|nr:hypothetical protein DPMN_130879 [Dreissena polymorpha]